eukprot:Gb_18187 [translate_table: standard]
MGDTKKRGANQGSGVGGRAGKRRNWSSLPASHVVAQMLAASYRIHTDLGRSMVVGFQDLILRALQKSSKDSSMVEGLLSDGLFAAMPVLLGSGLPQVSLNTAEIIGAAALWSYGINMKVASDKEVVKTLVAMISNPNEEFAVAACNAVLDLATTSIGRESLRESGAIAQLLFKVVRKSSTVALVELRFMEGQVRCLAMKCEKGQSFIKACSGQGKGRLLRQECQQFDNQQIECNT